MQIVKHQFLFSRRVAFTFAEKSAILPVCYVIFHKASRTNVKLKRYFIGNSHLKRPYQALYSIFILYEYNWGAFTFSLKEKCEAETSRE